MSSPPELVTVSVALMSGRLILDGALVSPSSTIGALRAQAEEALGESIKSLIGAGGSLAAADATLEEVGVRSGDQLLALLCPMSWDPGHGTTGRLEQDNTVLKASNNYQPVIASSSFCTGCNRWSVQGTNWGRSVTGVALDSVAGSAEWLGKLDNAWAFTSQQKQGNWRVVPDMNNGDWLTFVLDSDEGTLRVWHNDKEMSDLLVEGLKGKVLFPTGGCNSTDASLRLVPGGIDEGTPPA